MILLVLFLNFIAPLQGSEGADGGSARSPPVINLVPSIDELAASGGYTATNYEIITEDGYSLWLHRIGENSGSPVLIQHGIMLAADSWITRGHNKKDLAFMLLDLGYDVWLSNHRGTYFNEYSIKYPKSDPRFWNFSFHESGIYDLPASIDKVLEVRNVEKIFFVGHSLGTITFAVMCTLKPEYNNKVEAAMLMSPVIYMKRLDKMSLPLRVLAALKDFIISAIISSGNLYVGATKQDIRTMNFFCGEQAFTQYICLGILGFFAEEDFKNINPEDWSNFILHVSGTSLKTWIHDLQILMAGEFQQFDYGPMENMMKYNSLLPPKYNLNLLTTPIGLFWSYNDQLTDENSVNRIAEALPNLLVNWPIEDRTFSHLDMVIGDNANVVLYPYIINQIESINETRMQGKR